MAVFEKFGDETDINLPAESIGKVIFIIRQYPAQIVTTPIFDVENYVFSGISFPMAVFDKFGDETDINLPAELTGKVILIVRQYPAEIGTTPILDRGKIRYFHEYHFQWPFLKSLVMKLT